MRDGSLIFDFLRLFFIARGHHGPIQLQLVGHGDKAPGFGDANASVHRFQGVYC